MASLFHAWEVVIGLECHVQLKTKSKLFSPAPNRFGAPPNEQVDVVDVALPGTLPVCNAAVKDMALRLGLALGCRVNKRSVFSRKHYFYPDLPKGYQISQYDEPILEGGQLVVETEAGARAVPLTRIHIEEDAGKSLHVEGTSSSFMDYNRAGTPLLEVVSEPALRSADEAMAYFRTLRSVVMVLEICDGNLQEGSMRADANVSVRKKGDTQLGQRVELKNLNSPRFLAAAVESEMERQVLLLERGGTVTQETRLWDPDRRQSRVMRTKEDADDYRYMPDPDLPPLVVTDDEIERARAALPELPAARRDRWVRTYGLTPYDASVLVSEPALAAYFDDAVTAAGADGTRRAKAVANWTIGALLAALNERSEPAERARDVVPPAALAQLVGLIDDGTITGKIGKDVFAILVQGRADPLAVVEEHGWRVQKDEGALAAAVAAVIAENPGEWAKLKEGKGKVMGFFVGQVMKKTGGKADPKDVNRLLADALAKV